MKGLLVYELADFADFFEFVVALFWSLFFIFFIFLLFLSFGKHGGLVLVRCAHVEAAFTRIFKVLYDKENPAIKGYGIDVYKGETKGEYGCGHYGWKPNLNKIVLG